MPTSGSTNFTVNRDQLIKDALIGIGAISHGETPSSEVLNHANRQLNHILKSMSARDIPLWTNRNAFIFLKKGQNSYNLGTAGDFSAYKYLRFTTTAVASAGSSVLTVTPSPLGLDIFINDRLLYEYPDGTRIDTTVALTGANTINIGNTVVTDVPIGTTIYTSRNIKIDRPIAISNAWRISTSDTTIPVYPISRDEWIRLGGKTSQAEVTQTYFDPQLDSSVLNVFPTPKNGLNVLGLRVQKPIDDMDNPTDTFELPQEWLLYLQTYLSLILSTPYPVVTEIKNTLKEIFAVESERLEGFDKENHTSLFIQPRAGK